MANQLCTFNNNLLAKQIAVETHCQRRQQQLKQIQCGGRRAHFNMETAELQSETELGDAETETELAIDLELTCADPRTQ